MTVGRIPTLPPSTPGTAVNRDEFVLPASSAQHRLWFIDGLRRGHPVYNIPAAFDLAGRLDVRALENSLVDLIARHETLRTSFTDTDAGLCQVIAAHATLTLPVVDLTGTPASERASRKEAFIGSFARRSFDLTAGPLIDVTLLKWSPTEHTLLLNVHHIVADGWSIGVLCRDLSHLYSGYVTESPPLLMPLEMQYADYAVWQRKRVEAGALEPQVAHWKRQLSGAPPAIDLPADRPLPPSKTYEGGVEWLHLAAGRYQELKEFARRHQVTPFVVLLAACDALLSRYAGTEDVVVGTPVADRFRVETEAMVGFLVNTVVLRSDLSGRPTVRELLGRLRAVVATATINHELPFDKLVEALRPTRHLSRTPIVQVMLALQPDPLEAFDLPGIETTPLAVHNGTAKFDLHFGFEETRGGLRCMLEYSTDLYEASTIRRMAAHLDVLLRGMVAQPECRIVDLPMVTAVERQQALVDWNQTAREYPADASVSRLFEAQVERAPDATAVVVGKERLTYRELNRRSNRLANHLRSAGVAPGATVGVCMERSSDFVVALLAVLKAGCAYVPLDPGYPASRLRVLTDDAAAAVVLTHRRTAAAGLGESRPRLDVDDLAGELAALPDDNPTGAAQGGDLAYVMYTSGSTGRPKGVAIPHRAVVRLVVNTNYVAIGRDDVVAQVSNQAFDAATFEIWGALLNGAALDVIDRETCLSPRLLAQAIREHGLTTMFLTSALFNAVASVEPAAFAPLRQLLVGGDVVEPRWAAEILRCGAPARLLNGYGPTETTTFAAWYEIDEAAAAGATIPIGRPIANTTLYVLDDRLQPVPVGVTGELYIGGAGLARGYLNDEALTQQRFMTAPFEGGVRLYRTGDAARYRADGNIEFRGRLDTQVKLRGFRVEPGEVEATLIRHPLVASAAVVVREDEPGDKRLVAYLVGAQGGPGSLVEEARAWLATQLPDYMVPSSLVELPALPLTANGKLDRAALPAPDKRAGSQPPQPPRTPTEAIVAGIWAAVLHLDAVAVEDNFFAVGGHSLAALRVFAQIQRQFGVGLPLATLFEAPTVAKLAAILDAVRLPVDLQSVSPPRRDAAVRAALAGDGGDAAADAGVRLSIDTIRRSPCLAAIQPAGSKPPFFVLPGAGGNILGFQGVPRYLDPDQPVIGLESLGRDGRDVPLTNLQAIAARFVREMRSLQPEGPYALGGISFGGMVALEIAQQLLASGQRVSLLALLDTGLTSPAELEQSASWSTKASDLGQRALRIASALLIGSEGDRVAYLRKRADRVRRRIIFRRWRNRNEIRTIAARINNGEQLPITEALRHVRQANILAYRAYRPVHYHDAITLFYATHREDGDAAKANWRALCDSLTVHPVPGDHTTMMHEPNVQVLARKLSEALDRAHRETLESTGPA